MTEQEAIDTFYSDLIDVCAANDFRAPNKDDFESGWNAALEWVKQGQEPTDFIYETVMDNGILNLYIGYQSVLNLATPNEKITKRIPLYKFPHPVVLDAQKTFVIENQDAVDALNKIIAILGNVKGTDNLQDVHSKVFEIAYLQQSKSQKLHFPEQTPSTNYEPDAIELTQALIDILEIALDSDHRDLTTIVALCRKALAKWEGKQ